MRRTTLALAAVLSLAGSRALAAQSDAPDSATSAPTDSLIASEPAAPEAGATDLERRQQAQKEEQAHRKNHRPRGERDGTRRGSGEVRTRRPEGAGARVRRPEGGGGLPRHPHGGSDKPKPNQ